jgi:predicted RNase H-like HicB family nuclease
MKQLDDYLGLKYPFAVTPYCEEDFSGYRAFLFDIPAVESLGETPEEALRELEGAKAEWFAYALAKGIRIPEPDPIFTTAAAYSGRVTLRIPKALHRQAAEIATLEGVSLNAYLTTAIQRGIGTDDAARIFSEVQRLLQTALRSEIASEF